MKTVLFFLCLLGTSAAIPTNARFLSDHSKPTAETLVTPNNKKIPTVRVEAADNEKETTVSTENHPNHKAEQSSTLRSEEGTHEQSAEQDKTHSYELELVDQGSDDDLSVNLEYSPTEVNLEPKEDTIESQKKKLPENIDFPATNVTLFVDSNQQENITQGEENQEQPVNDSHLQLNKNSTQNQDLREEESQEQDPNIPNGKEEEEKEPGEDGNPMDNPDREEEFPEENSNSKQEEDSRHSDDTLDESNQPTQVSRMQEDEFEQGNQEEEDNSNAEIEEDSASNINKHVQDTEWQSQEGETGLVAVGNHKDTDKKTVSEALLMDPTDDSHMTPRNPGADADGGNDDSKHSASDDYFVPSQDFIEAEKAQSISYHLKYEEERERARKNENVDTSEPGDHQGAKKAQSSSNEEETWSEDHERVHSVDSCVNFQCKRGHVCKAEPQGKPHCVCQDPVACPPAKPLDQACGTDNQTYASSCHLFATKCRLEGTKKGHQLQLDYFGACKSIPVCTDFEVAQFPLRMRDWLKNILMQLYEPNPKHAGYLNEKQRSKVKKIYLDEKRLLAGDHPIELLLRDFKKNYHMYVYPVHWQFNELDRHPMDRVLTHSELAPLRASLVPMEHCITRFFEECDPNKDKHITLKEWGHCFGIKEEDIDENLLF
ncbi:SPARC-like protein 1 [Heterocephalus glaber]|uniref:SPARC-like protein 1 n=1 Tax=Heterocephalus glaber TaxID=10181 RepID=G5BSU7_HETGA|nr:SPARC-like protein 1 [Heterocephalus glaber]EHB12358.1 SPARC-like protein 1 [Heterocephalus glaber]